MIATYQHNISQHCWPSICKLQPNYCNISAQHTLYHNIVGCNMLLHMFGHPVAMLCDMLGFENQTSAQVGATLFKPGHNNDHNIILNPQMLHEKLDPFQIWANSTQHVATPRNSVAKHAQHVAPNTVEIYCDRGLKDDFQSVILRSLRTLMFKSLHYKQMT